MHDDLNHDVNFRRMSVKQAQSLIEAIKDIQKRARQNEKLNNNKYQHDKYQHDRVDKGLLRDFNLLYPEAHIALDAIENLPCDAACLNAFFKHKIDIYLKTHKQCKRSDSEKAENKAKKIQILLNF